MAKRMREKALKQADNRDKRPYATATNIRISPYKVNMVMSTIRNKSVDEALATLEFLPNASSVAVFKLIKSAAANAENKLSLSKEELFVAEAYATPGPIMKRMLPRGHGSADRMLKRTCHITVILDSKESPIGRPDKKDAAVKPSVKAAAKPATKASAKPAAKTVVAKPAAKATATKASAPKATAVKTTTKAPVAKAPAATKVAAKPATKPAAVKASATTKSAATKTAAKPSVKPAAKTGAKKEGGAK